MPRGGFTRTPGFYKNRPVITLAILNGAGGLDVCGVHITNVDVDSASSALEAMCVSIEGTTKLQLARSLMAAALTQAAGGATFGGFALCDGVCQDPAASKDEISACIKVAGAFNGSGDNCRVLRTWRVSAELQVRRGLSENGG